ncbi:MAG: ribonuclease H-like domain-containing protein [Gammaproteobacteria bacterium]
MNLRTRLSQLRPQNATNEAIKPTLAELRARIERITAARPGARKRMSETELAQAVGGERIDDCLIAIDRVLPLDALPPCPANGEETRAAFEFFGYPCDPGEVVYLDTETTGLAGGTGTLAFVLGLARGSISGIQLRQLMLTRVHGEQTMLAAARAFVQGAAVLVSYNGKGFDGPLLAARYRLAGRADPFAAIRHWDLLATTRRAFGGHWPDCRLRTAEERLLGFTRVNDLPGALVPQAWFNWLRRGNGAELPRVIAHNHWDLVSLAALPRRLHRCYLDPIHHQSSLTAGARHLLEQGQKQSAFDHLLRHQPHLGVDDALLLARLAQQRGQWPLAISIWERLAGADTIEAIEKLAKYCEHRLRDWRRALAYTERLQALEPSCAAHGLRARRLARKRGESGRS